MNMNAKRMRRTSSVATFAAALLIALGAVAPLGAQPVPPDGERDRWRAIPTITVTGTAQGSVRPDRAVIQLGAVAQAEQASAAQEQVNEIMANAVQAIRDLGVAEEDITTVGVSLHPVYAGEQRPPRPMDGGAPQEPRIVGYRASNRIRVELDDLAKVGGVIDAGVAAGANSIEDLSFSVKDETSARADALRDAAQQARTKAQAIADALGVNLGGILDVTESGAQVYPVRMEMARAGVAMMDAGTPIQPGRVQVDANVTVTYRVSGGAAAGGGGGAAGAPDAPAPRRPRGGEQRD